MTELAERRITVIIILFVCLISAFTYFTGRSHERKTLSEEFNRCLIAGDTGKTNAVCLLPNGRKMFRISLKEFNLGGVKGKVGTYVVEMIEEE